MKQNLFLGIAPDHSTRSLLSRRAQLTCTKHGFQGRPITPERLHISLHGFGEYHPQLAETVSRIAETIRFAPFDVTLDHALTFRNRDPHPFVLTCHDRLEPLRAFHRKLAEALNLVIERAFKPHLTLIWDTKMIPEYKIDKPVTLTVREFVLIRSFVGESRYEFVGRWPLQS